MDYSAYNRIINERLVVFLVVGSIIVIVACACIAYLLKNKPDEKYVFLILLVLLSAVIIGAFFLVGDIVLTSTYDLQHQSYIVSEGGFCVVDDEQTPSRGCSLILSDGTRLDTRRYVFNTGNYVGRIVYGEKTRLVVEVEID